MCPVDINIAKRNVFGNFDDLKIPIKGSAAGELWADYLNTVRFHWDPFKINRTQFVIISMRIRGIYHSVEKQSAR